MKTVSFLQRCYNRPISMKNGVQRGRSDEIYAVITQNSPCHVGHGIQITMDFLPLGLNDLEKKVRD